MRANTMALGGLALLLAASLALPVIAQEEKKAEKQRKRRKPNRPKLKRRRFQATSVYWIPKKTT